MGSGVKISKNILQNINKDDVHTTQERAVMGNWTQTLLLASRSRDLPLPQTPLRGAVTSKLVFVLDLNASK